QVLDRQQLARDLVEGLGLDALGVGRQRVEARLDGLLSGDRHQRAPADSASSSDRNRSTVPERRASSASDSPTMRPARSTAISPTSERSSVSSCWRDAASESLPAVMMRSASERASV